MYRHLVYDGRVSYHTQNRAGFCGDFIGNFIEASSVQQIYVFPEYVCFPSSSLSELLASFVLFHFRNYFWFYCLLVLFWSCLCRCVLVPGTLAFHLLGTCFFFFFLWVSLCPTACDHRISISLGEGIRTDTGCTGEAG